MATDYENTWEAMNSLEQITSKVISAREILNSSRHYLECHETQRAESLIVAAQEFLEYYLKEFDEKFKVAWNETVVKSKTDGFYWDTDFKGNRDCMDNSSANVYNAPWMNNQEATKKTWTLPVEDYWNADAGETDYFISLPDDLLQQVGWSEGTEVIWKDNGDGSYCLERAV
jgi:hypothetical protein